MVTTRTQAKIKVKGQVDDFAVSCDFVVYCTTLLYSIALQPFKAASVL